MTIFGIFVHIWEPVNYLGKYWKIVKFSADALLHAFFYREKIEMVIHL